MYDYEPKGVCSRMISVELDDNEAVSEVKITGGCPGNSQGLSALCVGRPAREVMQRLKGIHCGVKSTSCPDQLTAAIEAALRELNPQQ